MESFLQVGVLLGDGLLEDGLLELKICRQSASPGESELQGERVAGGASCSGGITFVGCFDLLVSAFVFAVIVLCFCLLKGQAWIRKE